MQTQLPDTLRTESQELSGLSEAATPSVTLEDTQVTEGYVHSLSLVLLFALSLSFSLIVSFALTSL